MHNALRGRAFRVTGPGRFLITPLQNKSIKFNRTRMKQSYKKVFPDQNIRSVYPESKYLYCDIPGFGEYPVIYVKRFVPFQ